MRRSIARAVQASARVAVPSLGGRFRPAPDLAAWAMETFVIDGAPLENPEHKHLRVARIGFLWAPSANKRSGRDILGTCQFGLGRISDAWLKAQREEQLRDWFGEWWKGLEPQFVVTILADYWEHPDTTDAMRCALIEHELLHAGHKKNEFGMPMFTQDGLPVYCSRPHDYEEFGSVIERYGTDATHMQRIEAAVRKGPTIAPASIASACGTCRR